MIDLVQRSTIHGVNHIYNSRKKSFKMFWVFLFVSGIIGISVNIVFIFMKYLSNPVTLSQHLKYEPFIWPDLTFCNPTAPYDFLDNPKIFRRWKSVMRLSKPIVPIIINKTRIFLGEYRYLAELLERTVSMSSADPQKMAIDKYRNYFRDIMYSKTRTGIYFTKNLDIIRSESIMQNFNTMFSTQYMQFLNNIPCHTLHVDRIEGIHQNLIQSLIIEANFYYENYKVFNSSYGTRQYLLFISNRNELPQKKPIVLLPGFRNSIRLVQTRFHQHGLRRPCRHDKYQVELYDALLQSTRRFEGNADDCKTILSQELYVKHCNCYSPFLPIYKNVSGFPRLCLNASLYSAENIVMNAKCIDEVTTLFYNATRFDEIYNKMCKKYEQVKCDEIDNKIEVTEELNYELWTKNLNDNKNDLLKSTYKWTFYKDNVAENYLDIIRDNFIFLTLSRDTEYRDVYKEHSAYQFSELLSDIGGLMGLYLGMSVIGLFEIVEYFYWYFRKINDKRRVPESTSKELL